jgi:hypothetical protein
MKAVKFRAIFTVVEALRQSICGGPYQQQQI